MPTSGNSRNLPNEKISPPAVRQTTIQTETAILRDFPPRICTWTWKPLHRPIPHTAEAASVRSIGPLAAPICSFPVLDVWKFRNLKPPDFLPASSCFLKTSRTQPSATGSCAIACLCQSRANRRFVFTHCTRNLELTRPSAASRLLLTSEAFSRKLFGQNCNLKT